MRHASLFSGLGGFEMAADWMGWENVLQSEINPFCRKILKFYHPSARLYGDIRTLDGTQWKNKIDVLTGGFPCQPFSAAGRRRGKSDNRFLWPEMLRIIREARPTWICGENVAGLISMAQFEREPPMDGEGRAEGDCGDVFHRTGSGLLREILEALRSDGYAVQPVVIPACGVGAPHQRYRIWIVAHDERLGRSAGKLQKRGGDGQGACAWQAIVPPEPACASALAADAESSCVRTGLRTGGSGGFRRRRSDDGSCHDADTDRRRQQGQKLAMERKQDAKDTDRERADRHAHDAERSGLEGHAGHEHRAQGRQKQTRPVQPADWREPWSEAAARLCRVDDGLSRRLHGITVSDWRIKSLEAYGNAIVPQVAFQIFQAIEAAEHDA